MAAVAAMLGMDSAAITVFGRRHTQAMVATSDPTARAAHDLEFVIGEGPATDATTSGAPVVVVGGPAVRGRWPQYGAAVAELGVRAVVAAPLTLPTVRLGALCGFAGRSSLHDDVATSVDKVADALTHTVLLTALERGAEPSLFAEADYQAVVHQAVGVVSVQCDCDLDDALAMLRARSFADGQSVAAIATRIVDGTLRLY